MQGNEGELAESMMGHRLRASAEYNSIARETGPVSPLVGRDGRGRGGAAGITAADTKDAR
jgi:hypothetical protein